MPASMSFVDCQHWSPAVDPAAPPGTNTCAIGMHEGRPTVQQCVNCRARAGRFSQHQLKPFALPIAEDVGRIVEACRSICQACDMFIGFETRDEKSKFEEFVRCAACICHRKRVSLVVGICPRRLFARGVILSPQKNGG